MASHLGLDAIDLAKTELVNLVRRHVRSRPRIDVVLVALLAVRQEVIASAVRPCGAYSVRNERGESPISGNHITVDRVGDLLGQAILIVGRKFPQDIFWWVEEMDRHR